HAQTQVTDARVEQLKADGFPAVEQLEFLGGEHGSGSTIAAGRSAHSGGTPAWPGDGFPRIDKILAGIAGAEDATLRCQGKDPGGCSVARPSYHTSPATGKGEAGRRDHA